MSGCALCDLPVSEQPVTGDIDGEYCCQGCLEVARVLSDVPESNHDEVRMQSESDAVPEDSAQAYLFIGGMHCTTCEVFLGYRGEQVDGIYSLEANYATETARVQYDPELVDEEELPELLSGRGYTARFRSASDTPDEAQTENRTATVERLFVGAFFAMLVMPWYLFFLYPSYVGIETGIINADATSSHGLYIPLVFIGVFTTIVLFYTGYPVLRGAWVSLRMGHPNMDLLVSIAALSAYAYSTVALATGSMHLYYDVSVAVIMVVTLGRYYEGSIRARTTDALSALTAARVSEATRLRDDGREVVSVAELEPGDELVVAPGDRVPVDGTVKAGVAAVDEAVLTGEALPVTKRPGDEVVGGSVVTDDALVIAVGPDAESTIDRITTALWEIQSATPSVQRFADSLATIFVPLVLVLGTVVTLWQLTTGSAVSAALLAGLTVLVVSCPCAMGLATPLAIAAGLRDALARGIVVTNDSLFEVAPNAEIIVFDKTGTLTAGKMTVHGVVGDSKTVKMAAAVERFSSHPVADAILDAALTHEHNAVTDGGVAVETPSEPPVRFDDERLGHLPEATEFTRHPGSGVSGTVDGTRVVVGTKSLVETECGPVSEALKSEITAAERAGELPIVVGWDNRAKGVLRVSDRERETWDEALSAVGECEVAVLTGDETPATQFSEHPAVDRVFSGVPPDGKVETIRRLAATGTTVMVGDGTNDAPALAAADLGIAMGDGTARAADAADVVVMDNDLTAVGDVFELASGTRRRIRENIGWAFLYNAVAIPLAVVGLINPLFAAVAMAASSIIVVSNSRRAV